MKKLNKKGFTLIELLVVIAIIGLLSTLAVVALSNARIKARDAKRQSDLKVLQTAIEMYIADNGHVPGPGAANGTGVAPGSDDKWDGTTVTGDLQTLLAEYLQGGLPQDPLVNTHQWAYCYWNSTSGALSSNYMIATVLERPQTIQGDIDTSTWSNTECISAYNGAALGTGINCSDTSTVGLIDATTGTTVCLGSSSH